MQSPTQDFFALFDPQFLHGMSHGGMSEDALMLALPTSSQMPKAPATGAKASDITTQRPTIQFVMVRACRMQITAYYTS